MCNAHVPIDKVTMVEMHDVTLVPFESFAMDCDEEFMQFVKQNKAQNIMVKKTRNDMNVCNR